VKTCLAIAFVLALALSGCAPAAATEPPSAPAAAAPGPIEAMHVQLSNGRPRVPIITQPSGLLEDNGIGGIWSPRDSSFADVIRDEIVPLGLKRLRLQFNEGENTPIAEGGYGIDWTRSEMPLPSDMQGIVPQLLEHGIGIDYVLLFWDKANHPQGWEVNPRFQTQEEIDRYLEFVRDVVSAFKGSVQMYELWNEPNVGAPLQHIEIQDYIRLARLAIPLIHKLDPDARVSVGGVSGLANPAAQDYLFELIQSDVMFLPDVLSWHPFYGEIPWEGQHPDYYAGYTRLLDQIKDISRAHGFQGEFIADEITYSAGPCGGCDETVSISEIVAAKYMARAVMLHRGSDVMAGLGGISINQPVHFATLQNLAAVFAGAEAAPFNVQVQSGVKDLRIYTFGRTDGDMLVAIWNDGPAVDEPLGVPTTVTIPGFEGWAATGIDVLDGFEQDLIAEGGSGRLILNGFLIKDYPTIIRLAK
jgi:hypothetical protein